MTLIKFMLFGLALTAICGLLAYVMFGEAVALIVVMIVGLVTQHGSLFAATIGWPHYGFWE